ncbi:hypothetical protein CDV36_005089 [Fusarium kuroshium]|uniref:Uncharacterized protein n=2 Tax=Fusarium solani species complex TaxID=232080 RepID=A0A3M2SCI1_9HYPO|nr:hypothetical protein CDV36_005089 [Fusarium kuroshium]RSL75382.1 hypothetical protein CEP51_010913 [Fusarium floridanum]
MTFWNFVRAQWTHLPLVPTETTVTGGTYIVTGANTGLGFECAKTLVRLGAKTVILGVRSIEKGDVAATAIAKETGREGVCQVWHLDLASLDSVEEFAKKVKTLDRIDALIQNASVALADYTLSEGVETTLTVNVLSTMLLAIRAMPKLQESARTFSINPHLVIVSSLTGFQCEGVLEKHNGDLFDALSTKEADMVGRYPLSKLLQIYATRHLASLFPLSETGVVINVLNPGLCKTELNRNARGFMKYQILLLRLFIGRTPEQGSRTLLHAAVAGTESHGKYVSDCEIKEYLVLGWVSDDSGLHMQRRVWMDLLKNLNARGHHVESL